MDLRLPLVATAIKRQFPGRDRISRPIKRIKLLENWWFSSMCNKTQIHSKFTISFSYN